MNAIRVGRATSETLDHLYGLLCRSAEPSIDEEKPQFALITKRDYLRDIKIAAFRRALKRRIFYLRKHR